MKKYNLCFVSMIVAGTMALAPALAPVADAQTPSLPPPPYNMVIPNPAANTPPVQYVIKNTLQVPGTINSNIISVLAYNGVMCSVAQSAESGSPSVTIAIQAYDVANATFLTLVTSGVMNNTTFNTPTIIQIRAGDQTTALPTGMTTLSISPPRYIRVQEVVQATSANPATTGFVECELLK